MPSQIRRSISPASLLLTLGIFGGAAILGPTVEAAMPANVKAGGTFVVALPGDPEVINSGITSDISSSNISGQVYDTIVRLDNDGNVTPGLAKTWNVSEDGLTYTFNLFAGVKWHD